jgi:hypothetical protein
LGQPRAARAHPVSLPRRDPAGRRLYRIAPRAAARPHPDRGRSGPRPSSPVASGCCTRTRRFGSATPSRRSRRSSSPAFRSTSSETRLDTLSPPSRAWRATRSADEEDDDGHARCVPWIAPSTCRS